MIKWLVLGFRRRIMASSYLLLRRRRLNSQNICMVSRIRSRRSACWKNGAEAITSNSISRTSSRRRSFSFRKKSKPLRRTSPHHNNSSRNRVAERLLTLWLRIAWRSSHGTCASKWVSWARRRWLLGRSVWTLTTRAELRSSRNSTEWGVVWARVLMRRCVLRSRHRRSGRWR